MVGRIPVIPMRAAEVWGWITVLPVKLCIGRLRERLVGKMNAGLLVDVVTDDTFSKRGCFTGSGGASKSLGAGRLVDISRSYHFDRRPEREFKSFSN